MVVNLSAEFNI